MVWAHIRSLFTKKVKLPGWLAVLLAIYNWVPDVYGRFAFWLEAVKAMGGNIGLIATIVTSPWFSLVLFLVGILYLLFVDEPKSKLHHPIWPIIGWTVVALVFLAFWSVLVAGYVADRVAQRETGEAEAKIASLSQDLEYMRQANKQLEGTVSDLQEKFKPWRIRKREEFVQALRATDPSTLDLNCEEDRDAEDLFEDLNRLLIDGGWVIRNRAKGGMSRRGVVIRVKDVHAPPPGAALLLRLLIDNEVVAGLVPAQANDTRITTTVFSVEIGRRLEIGDLKGEPLS